eukprot:gene18829-20725_t
MASQLRNFADIIGKHGLLLPSRRLIAVRSFSSCSPDFAGGKFRERQGKARDSLEYGPLTDLPDWTYLDGTAPPLSRKQLQRHKNRIETSSRVVTFLKEINAAKAASSRKKKDNEQAKSDNSNIS